MGLDVSFGMIVGLPLHEIVEESNKPVKITRYNVITGKPYLQNSWEESAVFLIDFGKFKKGERILWSTLQDYFAQIQNKDMELKTENWWENLLKYSDKYVGVYALKEQEPYEMPQDMYSECTEDLDKAGQKFFQLFGVVGRKLLYLHASY